MSTAPIALSKPAPANEIARPDTRLQVQKALNIVEQGKQADAAVPEREQLLKPVERINEALQPYSVRFELAEDSLQVITRIVDMKSGELIRQMPAEAVLRVAERLGELQGLMLDQEA